ncbi:hypothetical protein ACWDLG_18630 [Nonomuraea sp. NPDC003727]
MLKLLRMALTAAVLAAIAIRIDTRTRTAAPDQEPAPGLPATEHPGHPGHPGHQGRPGRPARPGQPGQPERRRRLDARFLAGALVGVLVAGVVAAGLYALAGRSPREADVRAGRMPMAGEAARSGAPQPPGQPAATAVPQPSPQPSRLSSPATGATPRPDPACSPERRPVTIRPLDRQVQRQVNAQWRRIERWLRRNDPAGYASLRGPGRARTIAVAESQMGLEFPDDLRASLLRHDGSTGPFGFGFAEKGTHNLSIRGIRDAWRQMCALDPTDSGGDPRAETWNGRMIPYAARNGTDRRPDFGVIDSVVGDVKAPGMRDVRWPSYLALLSAVADMLESPDGWYSGVVKRPPSSEATESG